MPRRRPPGAGPGLSTTLLAVLLVLPWVATAAQQQQPSHNGFRGSPREDARVDTLTPSKSAKPDRLRLVSSSKPGRQTAIIRQDERALVTLSSAPVDASAVRAPPARNAASSGGLTPSARSLQDWEVEDFVLLATVDGHIHARDRYNGNEIWEFDGGVPMVETTYHKNDSNDAKDARFLWIVEPTENGKIYVLLPGPQPVLQELGHTIKQLAAQEAYYSTDPPMVYTAEKKSNLYVLDARNGSVIKHFGPGGSMGIGDESCKPQATGFAESRRDECKGYFNLGRTDYTVTIANSLTSETICTIKYFEWTPNYRDRDLHEQYRTTLDNQYVYSRYDGGIFVYDHNKPKRVALQRPVFHDKFSSPVVRVFDVARPFDDDNPEPALVLLPQPPGPATIEDKETKVWVNTTDAGSWYAMSELKYPSVTDRAPKALCYDSDQQSDLMTWDEVYTLPDREGLVGVHSLNYDFAPPPHVPLVGLPAPSEPPRTVVSQPSPKELPAPPRVNIEVETKKLQWSISLLMVLFVLPLLGYYGSGQGTKLHQVKDKLMSHFLKSEHGKPVGMSVPAVADPEPSQTDIPVDLPAPEAAETQPPTNDIPEPESIVIEPKERKASKVRFDIPEEEEELEPLSRVTTAEAVSPDVDDTYAEGVLGSEPVQPPSNGVDGDVQVVTVPGATPTKKKKTHRGKRGGKKGKKGKEDDEVERILSAAKQLDQTPTLHPDEVTYDGDDVQDVSNIKKIGKLTIDCDRVLGNGSGGTFVFEGKWNNKLVAVKRMLPQYYGLAEQEVKLLQDSDLHPNVIRYFDDEKDENFLYIAVEICQANLWDLYRDGRPDGELSENQQKLVNEINCDVPRALYQLALGLNHLHSLRIIHRDVKPQNILIAYPSRGQESGPRLVISDFGLCKTLPDNVSTLIGTTGNAGTVGWKAPELILQPKEIGGSSTGHSRDSSSSTDPVAQGVKRAVDIFSLGCVFFYVLTNGSHPFDDDEGWMQIREYNIKKNKANFTQLRLGDDSEEPIHLISWMLEPLPERRPTAVQVMNHPFFWTAEKRLNFLCDCSDHWEREPRDPPSEHLSILEEYSYDVLDKKRNFLAKLDHGFIASLGKQRKYTGDRMLDLLRALRNKKNHYEDMDEVVKTKVGPLPHGYLRYWTTKFPTLLMSCYDCVRDCGLTDEPRFKAYFEGAVDRRVAMG